MNTKAQGGSKLDFLLWSVIIVLIGVGIAANFYFFQQPLPVKLIGWLVLVCILGLIAFQTAVGKKSWNFIRESRMELRKVVWPTRQETVQTTLIVIGMVVLTALILWGVDSILLWAVALLTGQRG